MLEKLYKLGLLNYEKLLRMMYHNLNLSEKDVMILSAILDKFDENIDQNLIANSYNFKISDVENCLALLLELDYMEIYMDILPDNRQKETYRLSPLFKKLELLISKQKNEPTSEIGEVIATIEEATKRMLTPGELETISSWFEEGISFLKIKSEMDKLGSSLSVRNLEKALYKKEVPIKEENKKSTSNLKKVFEMVKNQ